MIAPTWMPIALRELGVTETPGPEHTLRILEYHRATDGDADEVTDELPWCSSFVCWVMTRAGLLSTRSKAARSWLVWGAAVEPQYGAVAVFSRGQSWQGHVGFCIDLDSARVWIVGGNQGNSVSVVAYPRGRLLSFRWPAAVGGQIA